MLIDTSTVLGPNLTDQVARYKHSDQPWKLVFAFKKCDVHSSFE